MAHLKKSRRFKIPCIPDWTKHQLITFVIGAIAHFSSAICTSIQAPFFPAEAERKGATPSQYGFVFGCFHLTVFLFSPLFGKYLNASRIRLMTTGGLFVFGIAAFLFGALHFINDPKGFIGLSFLVRIIEALSATSFHTAIFAIVADTFPGAVAVTFASMQTYYGIGMLVGPGFGGILFQWGGYTAPFIFVGFLLLLSSILFFFLLPSSANSYSSFDESDKKGGFLQMIKIPSISLALYGVFVGTSCLGFLDATLEPHLRQFELSPSIMGLIFTIGGAVFAITGPIFGYIVEKLIKPTTCILLGTLLILLGFTLIGPIHFLPLETTLSLAICGLVFSAMGIESLLVSGYSEPLQTSKLCGFPDNLNTFGLVSGLWNSSLALGLSVGPSVAGLLFEHVGFRTGSYFIMGIAVVLGAWTVFIQFCLPEPSSSEMRKSEMSQTIDSNSAKYGSLDEPVP